MEINGSYEEKKISTADSDVINKAFGYDSGTNSVLVCGENSKGYIDWNKSSIPHWKVYQTEVFTPVLSRDTEGNLVVKTDSNGKLATKENGLYGKQTVYAGYDDPSTFVYKISWGDNHFSPSQGGNKSDDGKYYYADNEINLNMGLKTYEFAAYDGLTYLGKQTQNIEDVYIVRVCYTADDKMNYTYTSSLQDRGEGGYDINGNYVDFSSDDAWAEYNKDRTLRYIDFWILPEGVSTVLNFEDETPAPSPSEDNYTVDLGDSQIVSADTFATILAENATKDVIIKSNNNVTFTFAKGTMSSVDGKTEYDFSTSINSAYADTMPSYITKDNFVSQINFNYSGKLPATANIRFYAGTEYAGQTLYYSLMNADNTFAEVQSGVICDKKIFAKTLLKEKLRSRRLAIMLIDFMKDESVRLSKINSTKNPDTRLLFDDLPSVADDVKRTFYLIIDIDETIRSERDIVDYCIYGGWINKEFVEVLGKEEVLPIFEDLIPDILQRKMVMICG